MTTNNISVFSQPVMKSDISAGKAEGKEDINLADADMFAEFMDRSASMQAPDINADRQDKNVSAKQTTPEESYNKMQSGSHSNVKAKDEKAEKAEAVTPEKKEAVNTKAEKIKDSIKDKLGVSDEDIEKVMELLGFTDMDLFDQSALVQLVTELSGAESAVDLLSMPGMSDLLDMVTDIRSELSTELGVSPEGLDDVLKLMEEPVNEETFVIPAETAADPSNLPVQEVQTEIQGAEKTAADEGALKEVTKQSVETPDDKAQAAAENINIAVKAEPAQKTEKPVTDENGQVKSETQDDGEELVTVKTENTDAGAKEGSDTFGQQTNTAAKGDTTPRVKEDAGREAIHGVSDANISVHNGMEAVGAEPEVQSYIDVDSLIEQFATLTKELENDQTTLSMRLNPENLGQLTLHVTEKQGNVTAEVRVENEQVRDALNAQIAELRANLESAGVKVTAVEVTVESHEFESAYENLTGSETGGEGRDDGRPKSGEEAAEKIAGIRNINLNNPEEIADNLTEAEIVNASVMRDNGNSVDYRA